MTAELRKGVVYRMIGASHPQLKQKDDPEAFIEMQRMFVILVRHGANAL